MKRIILFLIVILLGFLFSKNEHFLEISAGVAIFLFGMLGLENGFKAFSGGVLEKFLKKMTNKLYKSLAFGVISTTLMQSSSLVSVITISFLSAGLIGLASGIGIIFGANLGTTTGAWLVAGFGLKVKISAYALPLVVFGILFVFQKSKKLQGLGYILSGIGFLFLGIAYMKDGFEAFKDTIDLASYAVGGFKGLMLYTFIGILATVIMQSSHATLVIIITALSVGQITYENALALAIGSNVGTTITAVLGAISANLEGKKLAAAHLVFNIVTGFIAIFFVQIFIKAVDFSAEILGIANDDYTLKLALFHTYFNFLGVAVFYPFINRLVLYLNKFIRPSKLEQKKFAQVRYLSESALEFPDSANEVLFKETKHLYSNAQRFIAYCISINPDDINSSFEIDEIMQMRNKPIKKDTEELYETLIKPIYSEIVKFAIKAQNNATEEQAKQLTEIRKATLYIAEAVKDAKHLQQNILKFIDSNNPYIKEEYNKIRENLLKQLRLLNVIFSTEEEDVIVLLFGKITLIAKKYDAISNQSLNKLIRDDKISNLMATSLMNDTSYAYDIANRLIKMAKTLFISRFPDRTVAREAVLLEDDEINIIN